jgi:uncharacterized membrane protein YGL010W
MLVGLVVLISCLLAKDAASTWLERGVALLTVIGAVLELLILQPYDRRL